MLDFNLVRGKQPLEVEFHVSLAQTLLHSMSLVTGAPHYEGFDQWVYATHVALSPDLRTEMQTVLSLFGKGDLYIWPDRFPPNDPIHRDISALIAHLDTITKDDVRGSVQRLLDLLSCYYEEEFGEPVPPPPVENVAELRAFLERKFGERDLDLTIHLIQHPAELKARLISVVTRFWEDFFQEEYARCLPFMERSVAYHRQQSYSTDFPTLFTAITGRLLPDPFAEYKDTDVDRVICIPSCHIGPYVNLHPAEEDPSTLVLIYNCRPTGVPEREQVPPIQDLFPPLKALADETRLQILAMLDGRELYAQQIVERLDISQSAVSRHLQLMVAGGILSARKEDSMKYFSLNERTLAALAERLRSFRGKSG